MIYYYLYSNCLVLFDNFVFKLLGGKAAASRRRVRDVSAEQDRYVRDDGKKLNY